MVDLVDDIFLHRPVGIDRHADPAAYGLVVQAFEGWWTAARPLDADWVAAYEARARTAPRALPPGETEAEFQETVFYNAAEVEALSDEVVAQRRARLNRVGELLDGPGSIVGRTPGTMAPEGRTMCIHGG